VIFGVSAGGQIAGLCGLDPAVPARAVALWYPSTDLLSMADDVEAAGGEVDRGPGSREALMLGVSPAEAPDVARLASPVTHVRADSPPFLLMHGDADVLVPSRQSERLHDALLAVGASSSLVRVAGQTHMFAGIADTELDALADRTTAFLLTHVDRLVRIEAATSTTERTT
jgi:acetyl esterase/lipase